jgi:hypothetical protein
MILSCLRCGSLLARRVLVSLVLFSAIIVRFWLFVLPKIQQQKGWSARATFHASICDSTFGWKCNKEKQEIKDFNGSAI